MRGRLPFSLPRSENRTYRTPAPPLPLPPLVEHPVLRHVPFARAVCTLLMTSSFVRLRRRAASSFAPCTLTTGTASGVAAANDERWRPRVGPPWSRRESARAGCPRSSPAPRGANGTPRSTRHTPSSRPLAGRAAGGARPAAGGWCARPHHTPDREPLPIPPRLQRLVVVVKSSWEGRHAGGGRGGGGSRTPHPGAEAHIGVGRGGGEGGRGRAEAARHRRTGPAQLRRRRDRWSQAEEDGSERVRWMPLGSGRALFALDGTEVQYIHARGAHHGAVSERGGAGGGGGVAPRQHPRTPARRRHTPVHRRTLRRVRTRQRRLMASPPHGAHPSTLTRPLPKERGRSRRPRICQRCWRRRRQSAPAEPQWTWRRGQPFHRGGRRGHARRALAAMRGQTGAWSPRGCFTSRTIFCLLRGFFT